VPTEVFILAFAALLLVLHIQVAIRAKTKQYGIEWNMGARDEAMPAVSPVVGRLERARDNFLETLPIATIALFGVVVAGKANETTAIAGWIWFAARAVYLPLYWMGVPKVRTFVWAIGLAAILTVLGVLIFG
jgi:uncharacterized MAPEG superfamily protein